MPHIPEEIFDKILSCGIADRDFANCTSFVSRTFHQIVLPHKFRSLSFVISRESTFPIPKFCEAINAGDPFALSLAPLVQELSLVTGMGRRNVCRYKLNSLTHQFKRTINGVLSFRNLKKLIMKHCFTSFTTMEQLGKLLQLQSLHTLDCYYDSEGRDITKESFSFLSNLQSLHTIECHQEDGDSEDDYFSRHLACISMKNLRILKSGGLAVTKALLTFDPPVQLKELCLTRPYVGDYALLWNYLARVTSLTHLSLPSLKLQEGPPASLIFPFQGLQYLYIHVGFAPLFANQPLKEMNIYTESGTGQTMEEVNQHWHGVVFPHVEYLVTDRSYEEMAEIPIEFWREFLVKVSKVGAEFQVDEYDGVLLIEPND